MYNIKDTYILKSTNTLKPDVFMVDTSTPRVLDTPRTVLLLKCPSKGEARIRKIKIIGGADGDKFINFIFFWIKLEEN